MSQFSDKSLVCRDCGNEFNFSSGEQDFYATRGFSEPTRCPDCRAARKGAREGGGGGSSSFGRSSGGGYGSAARGGYGGGSGGYGGGRSQSSRQMYKVTCADCGIETEVPFEPRSGRPVYCRDCFEKRSGRR